MFVGTALSSHPSLTPEQVLLFAMHDGQLIEHLRTITPGVLPSWVNHDRPPGTCIASPPAVAWATDPAPEPIRVFCATTDGRLTARLLDPATLQARGWEMHDGPGSPMVVTTPGASLTAPVRMAYRPGVGRGPDRRDRRRGGIAPVTVVTRQSLFVGAEDGTLWERTRSGGAFSWVGHGSPPGLGVTGQPFTDPVLTWAAGPVRIFALSTASSLVERIIGGPAGVTWVDHGRPAGPGGPLNLAGTGVVAANPALGTVHVLVPGGGLLHALTIPALGARGTWSTPGGQVSLLPGIEETVETSPDAVTVVRTTSKFYAEFFLVVARRVRTPPLVGRLTNSVRRYRHEFGAGTFVVLESLGEVARPPLAGSEWYLISQVCGHAPALHRVYASSRPAHGTVESLDEWTYFPETGGAVTLGMPPGPLTRCTSGPRHFTVGWG